MLHCCSGFVALSSWQVARSPFETYETKSKRQLDPPQLLWTTGVPGDLVGGPRAYQGSFRGLKPHRVHARRGFFLHEQID